MPIGFVDLWNADKAGSLSLHARTGIAAVDGAAVALTRNARPADRVVLGGARQDLHVTVANWTNMTSAIVRLIGADSAGAAQTEDLALTGNGTFYVTKYFVTLTQSQVTAWSGTGSFDYEVKQMQWGVVWKLASNQYYIGPSTRLYIGDGGTETHFKTSNEAVRIDTQTLNTYNIQVRNNARFYSGTIVNESLKTSRDGSYLELLGGTSGSAIAMIYLDAGSYAYVVSSKLKGANAANNPCFMGSGSVTLWHCIIENCRTALWNANRNIYDVVCSNLQKFAEGGAGTYNDISVMIATYAFTCSYSSSITITGLVARSLTYGIQFWQFSGSAYLINCDFDAWAISYEGGTNNGRAYRQYTVDLKVTDKNDIAIEGATAILTDKDGTQVFSLTTDTNGDIITQTVTRGYYHQSTGNTLQESAPHTLTILKAGYQTYVKKFTITEKTKWAIKLAPVQPIMLDCGRPLVNLKPADPENKLVLSL